MINLRASITIEVAADDFIDAASQQARLQQILAEIRNEFPDSELQLRHRRDRISGSVLRPRRLMNQVRGRVDDYASREAGE